MVEEAEEMLPDPGDCSDDTFPARVGEFVINFRRVPTECERAREMGCFWKWELIGRVDPATP
jgi:hypothetical protein